VAVVAASGRARVAKRISRYTRKVSASPPRRAARARRSTIRARAVMVLRTVVPTAPRTTSSAVARSWSSTWRSLRGGDSSFSERRRTIAATTATARRSGRVPGPGAGPGRQGWGV